MKRRRVWPKPSPVDLSVPEAVRNRRSEPEISTLDFSPADGRPLPPFSTFIEPSDLARAELARMAAAAPPAGP